MRKDAILRLLTEEDIQSTETMEMFLDVSKEGTKLYENIQKEAYYCNDNLDFVRFMLNHFEGMEAMIPQIKSFRSLLKRYIEMRILEEPDIRVWTLCRETELSPRTIREYIRELNASKNVDISNINE